MCAARAFKVTGNVTIYLAYIYNIILYNNYNNSINAKVISKNITGIRDRQLN